MHSQHQAVSSLAHLAPLKIQISSRFSIPSQYSHIPKKLTGRFPMDGLSGAASVIAVVQITQSIASALKDYYEGVRDAREDIQKLYNSVKSLEHVLSTLQDLLNRRPDGSILDSDFFKSPTGPLRQVEQELLKLRVELKVVLKDSKASTRALRSLVWPFKKKGVEKTVIVIERHKLSLTLKIGIQILLVYAVPGFQKHQDPVSIL